LSKIVMFELRWFGIMDRLLGVTTDNASNNYKMNSCLEDLFSDVTVLQRVFKDAEEGLIDELSTTHFYKAQNQFECAAHVFNLAAQEVLKATRRKFDYQDNMSLGDFIKSQKNLKATDGSDISADLVVQGLNRLSFVIRKIRISPNLGKAFSFHSTALGLTDRVPVTDVCTRWNSTHDMIVFAIQYRRPLDKLISFHFSSIELTAGHWKVLKKLVDVLEPFKNATLEVSKGTILISR